MELSKITPKQAQEILKSNARNYINREDLEELKLIAGGQNTGLPPKTQNTSSGTPTPTRINQVLASVLVNGKLEVKWVDMMDLTPRSKEFLSLNFMVTDGVLRIPLGEKIDLDLDLLPNTIKYETDTGEGNTRPYKITYNNKTLEGEFTDDELSKHFRQEWGFVDPKYLFWSPTNESRTNIATFNLEDSFLSSTINQSENTFRLNSTDYNNLADLEQNGIELTSMVRQGFVKEIVLEKVNDNDLVSLLVSLLNITVPVNKIVFETNVEKDYSKRFPNLSDDGKILTYNVGEEMVLPSLQIYEDMFVELNTDFCEKRAVIVRAFVRFGGKDGLTATVNYTGKVTDNVTLTSSIYPKIGKAGPIFVSNSRTVDSSQRTFVTLYSSDMEEKIQNAPITLGNTQITVDDLKARVVEGQSEVTFSKTDVADNGNKTVFEILCLAGDLPPTVEKIIFKTDRVWDREPKE